MCLLADPSCWASKITDEFIRSINCNFICKISTLIAHVFREWVRGVVFQKKSGKEVNDKFPSEDDYRKSISCTDCVNNN